MQKLTLRVALVFSVDGGDHQEEVDFEMVCLKKCIKKISFKITEL